MADAGGGAGRWRGAAVDLVLVVVLAIGVVASLSTMVVHRVVLDDATYAAALARADTYERFYTEILADPEMAAIQDDLLGELRIPPSLVPQARALTNNALRWAVPPATLQGSTERVLDSTLAYVRGDTPRLVVDIDLVSTAEQVEEAVRTFVRSLLAETRVGRTLESIQEYRAAMGELVDDLREGRLPESIPRLGGAAVPTEDVVDALLAPLGDRVDAELRQLVTAAVGAGDDRSAVVAVASDVVEEHVEEVTAEWSESAGGPVVDLAARIEARAEARAESVLSSLDSVRALTRWFNPVTAAVGLVVALLAAVALWWRHAERPGRGLALAGAGLALAGVAMVVIWSIVGDAIAEPLDLATTTGPDSWAMPASVRDVLGDVRAELGDTLRTAVLWRAGAALVGGLLLVGVGLGLPALLHRLGAVRPSPAVIGAGATVVAVGVLVALGSPSSADPPQRCNGHAELCARPYDEVVQAATHNSMSSPEVVRVWPEHDGDLRDQLDAGIRALLIDTHYWEAMVSPQQLQEADPDLPDGLAGVLFRAAEPFAEERGGTWMCHNHCAFGGMPFLDGLVQVREFLEDNPDEVVTLVIQDAITVDDTVAAVADAGLEPYLHVHDPDGAWATLGEMIEGDERLVVFAEQAGPPPAWYLNAFEAMQETPFTVLAPDRFTCEPNRGPDDATLFLLNHWVQRIAPERSDAVVVNDHDVLVERARQCAEERGQLPDMIAVNFYNIGDVVAAVDTLNGVGA